MKKIALIIALVLCAISVSANAETTVFDAQTPAELTTKQINQLIYLRSTADMDLGTMANYLQRLGNPNQQETADQVGRVITDETALNAYMMKLYDQNRSVPQNAINTEYFILRQLNIIYQTLSRHSTYPLPLTDQLTSLTQSYMALGIAMSPVTPAASAFANSARINSYNLEYTLDSYLQ